MDTKVEMRTKVKRILEEYNLPQVYTLCYQNVNGAPINRDTENCLIGRYSTDILAICTAIKGRTF